MRRVSLAVWLGMAALAGSPTACLAQGPTTPTITSLQSSLAASSVPQFGAAITSGTSASSFNLYLNGSFNVFAVSSVTWLNTVTNVSVNLQIQSFSATQIVVSVPNYALVGSTQVSLYGDPVAAAQTIQITDTEQTGIALVAVPELITTATANFTLNPPLSAIPPPISESASVLPAGTTNQTYAFPIFTGGTSPYTWSQLVPPSGSLPPGLTLPVGPTASQTFFGTPKQAGLYQFGLQISDEWGNVFYPQYALEIVGNAVINAPVPASTPVGSNAVPITVTGTGLVPPTTGLNPNYAGSQIVIAGMVGDSLQTTVLPTTVVNGVATATIPANYLALPQGLVITVLQPNNSSSNGVTFQVLPQIVNSVSPSSVTARPTAVPVTVTGSSFLVSGAGSPSQSTIVINGSTPIATTFGSSTSLFGSVAFTTPGTVSFQVQNPGGYLSNAVNVTVLAAPAITSAAPNPYPGGTLTVNGSNFTSTMTVQFNGTSVPTTFVNSGQLRAAVPAALVTGSSALITVLTSDSYLTPALTIPISLVKITTASLAGTTELQPYDAVLALNSGTAPFTWIATGLPAGLSINTSTGEITGTPTVTGTFTVVVTVTDVNTFSNTAQYALVVAPPPPATITSVAPSPITARTTAVPVTVTGTNFVSNPAGTPTQSTILVNNAAVATTLNSATSLSASVVLSTPGAVSFQVQNPGGVLSNSVSVTVLPAPTVTSVAPSPFAGGKLTVNGTNFTSTMVVLFNGAAVPTTYVSATQLTATVPGTLYTGTVALISVQTTDNFVSNLVRVVLSPPLQITTASIPPATGLQPYDAKLAATGGTPPFTWTAGGLPRGLVINSATGEITGTPIAYGIFAVSVTVMDPNGLTSTASYSLPVSSPAPPPQITSGAPPAGFVNVSYNFAFSSSGGNGNVSFGYQGNLPPGLTMDSTGVLKGLPTTVGNYTFSVTATDADGLSSSVSYTLTIKPQPLSITTPGLLGTFGLGATISLKFASIGGVPPYSYSAGSGLPPGVTLSADGTLSGAATAPGTYTFTVTVSDSANTQPLGTKTFTITVNPTTLAVSTAFPDGQVGVPYSVQIGATGGVSPYSFTVTGLPAGLSYTNGAVSGTPTAGGPASVTVTVTDSAKVSASQTFTFKIAFPTLSVTTANLPNATLNVAYTGSVGATGGNGSYSWSFTGLPPGVTATASGALSGTPTAVGSYSISATVTDTAGNSASKAFTITVAAAPLVITVTPLPNPTAGATYSAAVTATGGVPPYTFSATGLPAGLTISSTGTISGTATAPGPATVSVTVTDSAGTTASQAFSLTVSLPPAPTLNLTGLPANSTPATQSTLQIGISTVYPVPVTVNLTLTFAADSGPDDPTVQFSTGGRTAQLTIPAGSTVALNTIGVQTGTVAGTATITAQLLAGSQDITPQPAPTRTVRINSVPPVAQAVTATSNSTGFTVTVTGYATARRITQAIFTFTPAAGVNLQTTTVTISVDTVFAAWYASSAAIQFGSQFIYSQPFTVSGGAGSIASVTVTLVNADGSSTPVTVTVH